MKFYSWNTNLLCKTADGGSWGVGCDVNIGWAPVTVWQYFCPAQGGSTSYPVGLLAKGCWQTVSSVKPDAGLEDKLTHSWF